MPSFIDKFYPIAAGTVFGFIIKWLLEINRLKSRRKRILVSLHTYLKAMPRYNEYNQTAINPKSPPKHIVPMLYPVNIFKDAVFSKNNIRVSNGTIQATINYIIKATEINNVINSIQSPQNLSKNDETLQLKRQFIFDQAIDELPQIIEKLTLQIVKEKKCWAGVERLWRP